MNNLESIILLPILALPTPLLALPATPENHSNEAEESANIVVLEEKASENIDLQVTKLQLQALPREITALGEIKLNSYQSAIIAPRISGQVVKRHVKMGDQVTLGQPLVTLSSIDMAEAQKQFIIASKEWQRVKALGEKVVSDKRFIETQSEWKFSQSKLLAMGITQAQLEKLKQNKQPNGEYQILSSLAGTVVNDEFLEGEYVEAGTQLLTVSNESILWVEAAVRPAKAVQLNIGSNVRIEIDGFFKNGVISQIDHQIDETTRTQMVRINVNNSEDRLHPGQFATSYLTTGLSEPALAIPEKAVTRTSDGDWSVFTEIEPGKYQQTEIEILNRAGDQVAISGLPAGTKVVTNGAFYLAAELAKGGFDTHGH